MKVSLGVCAILVFILALIFGAAVGDRRGVALMQPGLQQWSEMLRPHLWQAALVQTLLSTQIKSGYLISSGGNIYYKCNVKWYEKFYIHIYYYLFVIFSVFIHRTFSSSNNFFYYYFNFSHKNNSLSLLFL